MPKRIGETPPWLCRPSPGSRIFSDPIQNVPSSPTKSGKSNIGSGLTELPGPKRLIAQRGTEIFVAVGNKVRWADLAQVKDRYDDDTRHKEDTAPYRTLGLSIYYPIQQLVMSPSEQFLAVATEFTIHVVPLPDHASLSTSRKPSVKVKAMHLGPTTHVIPSSPIMSVLWHPLAAATATTDSLVTVTADAALRMWEIDRLNTFSAEQPALEVDLRKLADGVSSDQDFRPAGFGKSKGFSVDDIDMEVASCCFGGRGENDEDPWASMTLWTAMTNGDLYALCPLLPLKWQPTETTVPALSTSTVSKMALGADDVDADERRAIEQQYEWVSEIDNEEPLSPGADETAPETRMRPSRPGAIPRLQGPFEFDIDEDEDFEATDLYVFAPRLDDEDALEEDDFNQRSPNAIPYSTIILACSDKRVHVGLDLEGVSGQWLPNRARNSFSVPEAESKALVRLTTVELDESSFNLSFISFTPDIIHRNTIFASMGSKVYSISIDEWAERLAEEVSSDADADDRLRTRLATACQNQVAFVDTVLSVRDTLSENLSAPVVIDDLDVGYITITTSGSSVFGATFDPAHIRSLLYKQSSDFGAPTSLIQSRSGTSTLEPDGEIDIPPTRAIYEPPRCFEMSAQYTINELKHRLPPQNRGILQEKALRLSPAVLDLMTSAHRTVSGYTAELETAAAELFRRCERLREELGDQVKHMTELADKLQQVEERQDGEEERPGEERLNYDQRMENIKQKQALLKKRYEEVRRKAGHATSSRKPLSAKETVWIEEVGNMSKRIGSSEDEKPRAGSLEGRLREVSITLHVPKVPILTHVSGQTTTRTAQTTSG